MAKLKNYNIAKFEQHPFHLAEETRKKRFINKDVISIITAHVINYPTPVNLNYFWGFGSLSGFMLVWQIITGVLLAMHYSPDIDLAFNSVEHIMRNVNNGWLIRYAHSNGASAFFIMVYLHIGRAFYFRSYRKIGTWYTGIVMFLLMMATAFLGYVLPWGQMSLWGATVITNLFSAIPVIGNDIVTWLWGGFSVDNPTLKRFFVLHFVLPFALAAVSILHLVLLHKEGSTNPLGTDLSGIDDTRFYPKYATKDLFGGFCILIPFLWITIFFYPNYLGHPDNYIRADALVTPKHIVPEWYFLPFYAILRAIPDKLGGVIAMFSSILILFIFPFCGTFHAKSMVFSKPAQFFFWCFVSNFILLGRFGSKPIAWPYDIMSQICTVYYFSYFLIINPLLAFIERKSLEKPWK